MYEGVGTESVVFTHACVNFKVNDEAKVKIRTRLDILALLAARHLIVKTTPTRTSPVVILIQVSKWRALAFDQLNELPLETKCTESLRE